MYNTEMDYLHVPLGDVLLRLQQLLRFYQLLLNDDENQSADLQHLSALTGLVELDLYLVNPYTVTASMLGGTLRLTRLQLSGLNDFCLEPAALAGKTLLQHLKLSGRVQLGGDWRTGATGAAQLLSQPHRLEQLQQLTCLVLWSSQKASGPLPAAAAYSALTASSCLQRLDISGSCLPEGVWQHIFPAGRQLLHMRVLDISNVRHPGAGLEAYAAAPEGTCLVSCCPGLQILDVSRLQYDTELAGLQRLSSLERLTLGHAFFLRDELEVLCQLTGLRELTVLVPSGAAEGPLLQLTQLRQLTSLRYEGPLDGQQIAKNWSEVSQPPELVTLTHPCRGIEGDVLVGL
jgi:hypothetical protein